MTASRVAPRLWQGSVPRRDEIVFADVVVLCAKEHQFPDAGPRPFGPHARALRVPLDDSGRPPTSKEIRDAWNAGELVAQAHRKGYRILTTCAMGLNRSGLVNALALVHLGMSPHDAIAQIKRARGPGALSNAWFTHLVHSAAGRSILRIPIAPEVRPS